MADTEALTPLADRVISKADATVARIAEVPFRAQVGLRVDPKSSAAERIATAIGAMLPGDPGGVVVTRDLVVLWLGPDEWLIIGPVGAQDRIERTLNSALGGGFGAVVDVSAHRTIIEVSGERARDLLNSGCALDLHPRAFPAGRCASMLLARAQVVLVCCDAREPRYWVLVRASFARYLADWLADATTEFAPDVNDLVQL
ncbi:sarcosine oxidase subunit gamma family protein [Saccharopolyspora sp. NPDC002686]|uniref:sarcosine oxidase subunit gamma n=1 Tax=Saccharopolyspora sp. NPDC002686 TaxID=3154541 RepID=UPI003324E004